MSTRFLRLSLLIAVLATAFAGARADTVTYEYDALGRLTEVRHSDGSAVTYSLDAAGNRTEVETKTPPGVPASISVPSSSSTGSYTISWGSSTGTVTAYRLYEATNASFSGQSLVYDGAGTSSAISGKGNGTYYYRVHACNDGLCSDYRAGGNAVSVTLPPGVPASISVPSSSSTGSYTINWGSSTGTVTAYQLYEATNASFSGQVQVYTGTGTSHAISGKGNGSYYYRVWACEGSLCSGYRTGSNPTTVTLPPGVPASIAVPSSSTTGNYTLSWGAASGTVTAYELYEATDAGFSGQVQVYSGTGSSHAISGKANGTYYYRVRACNGGACSGYRTGSNPTTVTLPPGVPASIAVPSSSTTGNYTLNWGAASGTVTAYELYEANNSGFSGQSLVYSGAALNRAISGKVNGTYYYRVRACNGGACSAYRTGSNPTNVTLPPGVPASISVPSSSSTGSYTISWGTSTGTLTAYELYEATSAGFSGQVQVYSGTGSSHAISGKGNGSYYYRVRACNGGACSDYRSGGNAVSVSIPVPTAPASISGPSMSMTGNYTISWSASTGASRYELWESVFGSAFAKVYDGPGTSKFFSNKPNGEYEYKAKACNGTGCSGFSPTRMVLVCKSGCNFFAPPPGE